MCVPGAIMTTHRKAFTTGELPTPGGPYSTGACGGGLLFLSGQVAQDPATGELVDGDAASQAEQILRNLAVALQAVGKSLDDVVRVEVTALPLAAAVEMDAVVA